MGSAEEGDRMMDSCADALNKLIVEGHPKVSGPGFQLCQNPGSATIAESFQSFYDNGSAHPQIGCLSQNGYGEKQKFP